MSEKEKISIGNYHKIMSDRNIFNQIVYTPLSEALRLLDERQKDPELMVKVEKLLKGDIPEILKNNKKCAILFRQIATPNHESQFFCSLAKEYGLTPIIFEYFDDKFTSNNDFKHSLGQLRIHGCVNKKDNYPIEKITIINFNKYNGKKLKEVKTIWKEPLINFHRKLFEFYNYKAKDINFYDASFWFKKNGGEASGYYANFLLLFTCFGILFENFLLNENNDNNGKFTKDVVLPAIEKVINLIGLKPLIVPITPIDIEKDNFWISYYPDIKTLIG